MKLFKLGLRVWIGLTSLGTFMFGWIMIAHSPKPIQPVSSSSISAAPLSTLAPLAPLNFSNNGSVQSPSFSIQQAPAQSPIQNFFSQPSFRTGGS